MADTSPQDVPTVLGPDSSFKGEISFDKVLRIHGRFEGRIVSPGRLHVAREGRIEAEVEVAAISIEGEVHGRLTAGDRLELKASAHYEGDLRACRMVVEEGAVFCGHVSVGPDALKTPSPGPSRGGNGHSAATPIPDAMTR